MNRAQIIKAVQARMSDIMPGNQIEVSSQSYVDLLLNDAVENFYMLLPVNVLPHTDFNTTTPTLQPSDEVRVYRIKLPDNFIRLIAFRCADWRRSVSEAIAEGSSQHHAQYGKHTFGGNTRPQITLVADPSLGRSIEYYLYNKTTTNTNIIEASCAIKSDAEEIPENLIGVFAWYVASVAFQSMEEYDASKAAMERVNEFIQLHK